MQAGNDDYCDSNLDKSKYVCVSDQHLDTSGCSEHRSVSAHQLATRGYKCERDQLLNACEQSHDAELQTPMECGLQFDAQYFSQLEQHLIAPEGSELTLREDGLTSGQPLKQEDISVSPKPFVCLVCGQSYDQITTLQQHMMNHTNISCSDVSCPAEMGQLSPDMTADVVMQCSENIVKRENKTPPPSSLKEQRAYYCTQCSISCWSMSELRRHLLIHTDLDSASYDCHYCDFKCSEQSQCNGDPISHMEVNGFICSLCGLTCCSKTGLIHHTISHMNDSEDDRLLPSIDTNLSSFEVQKSCLKKKKIQKKCSDPSKLGYNSKHDFKTKSHQLLKEGQRKRRAENLITHRPDSDRSSTEQLINMKGDNCWEPRQSARYKNGQEPVHLEEENEAAININDPSVSALELMNYKEEIIEENYPHCAVCPGENESPEGRLPDNLMKTELSEDTEQGEDNFFLDKKHFQCKHCRFSCQSLAYLKRHMKSHTDLKFESCPYCEFSCWTSVQLKEHMVTHSEAGAQCWPFACEKCDFSCKTQRDLKRHNLTHLRVRLYFCTHCSFACDQKKALEDHQGLHRDTTPFLVNVCKFGDQGRRKLNGHKVRRGKRKVYRCPHCDFKGRTSQLMKKHLQTEHADQRPYSCDLCPFTCWLAKDLRAHELIHTDVKPFECTDCDYRCRRLTRLREHMMIHRNSKPFPCETCQRAFRTNYYLKRHLELGQCKRSANPKGTSGPEMCPATRQVSKPLVEATDVKNVIVTDDVTAESDAGTATNVNEKCDAKNNTEEEDVKNVILGGEAATIRSGDIETKVFVGSDEKNSVEGADLIKVKEDNLKQDGDDRNKDTVDLKVIATDAVGGLSRVKSAITAVFAENTFKHHRDERGGKLFKCSLCSYTCKKAYHLKRHMFGHSEERSFRCEHCNYATKTEDNLRRHSKRHSGVKPFSCKLCSYTCYEVGDLNRHLLTHTDFKAHKCPMCDYAGRTKYHLNEHMMTHSSLKPFLCSVCGKAFNSSSKLREHMFKHTTDKNIKCPECPFNCRRHSELKKHMKKHREAVDDPAKEKESQEAKTFLCTVCGTSFKYNSALKRHMITHSEHRPWQCPHCTFQCRTKDQLKTHVSRHQEMKLLECEVCSVTFKHSYSLRRHMLKHKSTDPMSCQLCDFTCFRGYDMKRHMRIKHKLELTI